ncbi:MAG TPA: RNA 2'-phosphotransferase [Bacteroidetes bacterium]|nr:RNA 2'-phosphotransferase [Bacteroidota bacterium]
MIDKKHHKKLSKFLSLVLRHKPETIGIELDENGWTDIDGLISKIKKYGKPIDTETLELIVKTSDKQRFAINKDGNKIRANQGHSVKIELGYKPKCPPEILYHGTGNKYVESILKTGLVKRNRHHVHLSTNMETAISVGKRHGKPVVFEVLAKKMHGDGFEFFLSENGVWLTDMVPVTYLRKYKNHIGQV